MVFSLRSLSFTTRVVWLLSALSMVIDSKSMADPPSTETLRTIRLGDLSLTVDPSVGGRIASFSLCEKEILRTDRDKNNWHWGSTVWISPQSDWNWPPHKTFDEASYKVLDQTQDTIEVVSDIDEDTGFQMTKRFKLQKSSTGIPQAVMTYRLVNHTQEEKQIGLWENSRFPWRGTIVFAKGSTIKMAKEDAPILSVQTQWGTQLKLDSSQPNGQKVFVTPPTLLGKDQNQTPRINVAYLTEHLVLVKSQERPRQVSPGQSPLEIYFAPEQDFVEIEFQGDSHRIAPGATVQWNVQWTLLPRHRPDSDSLQPWFSNEML